MFSLDDSLHPKCRSTLCDSDTRRRHSVINQSLLEENSWFSGKVLRDCHISHVSFILKGFFHNIFIVSITLIICSAEKSIIPHYKCYITNDITNAEGSVIFCSIFLVRNTGCQAMTWVLRGMNDRSILSKKMGLGRYSLFC